MRKHWTLIILIAFVATLISLYFSSTPTKTSKNTKQTLPIEQVQNKKLNSEVKDDIVIAENNAKEATIVESNNQVSVDEKSANTQEIDKVQCTLPELSEQKQAEQDKLFEQYFTERFNTDNPTEQLDTYLYGPIESLNITHDEKITFLSNFLAESPNKLAAMQLLTTCSLTPENSLCDVEGDRLSDAIRTTDDGNGMLWLELASLARKQKNEALFLKYFEIAANKQNYSEYFFEYIENFTENARGNLALDYSQTIAAAFGFTAALNAGYAPVAEFCSKEAQLNTSAFNICLTLSENLYVYGKSAIKQMFGAQLTKFLYEKLGEAKTQQRYTIKELTDFKNSYLSAATWETELMFFDESLFNTWMQVGLVYGEHKAIKTVVDEAKLKLQNPDYNPCPIQNHNN